MKVRYGNPAPAAGRSSHVESEPIDCDEVDGKRMQGFLRFLVEVEYETAIPKESSNLHGHLLSDAVRTILRLQLLIENKSQSSTTTINWAPENKTMICALNGVESTRVRHVRLNHSLENVSLITVKMIIVLHIHPFLSIWRLSVFPESQFQRVCGQGSAHHQLQQCAC